MSEVVKQRIKDLFRSAKDAQAERIARTETTRFVNEGKLQSFKDSGAEGLKTWLIVHDDRTSDICNSLNGQVFLTKDGQSGVNMPPMHVRCRSSIVGLVD